MKLGIIRGTFKILTPNHCFLIQEAKKIVDKLFIFIDSDDLIRAKGKVVILTQQERVEVLSSLKGVDGVVVFHDEQNFLEKLELHDRRYDTKIYFKGGDYAPKDLPEAEALKELGYTICCLTYHQGRHTQDIMEECY